MTTGAHNRRSYLARSLRLISSVLLLAGVAALTYAGYVVVSARYFQTTEAAKFAKTARVESVSAPTRPLRAPRVVTHGSVIGTIDIPRVGINAVVLQGDSSDVLRHAVGHVPNTPLPGEPGNVALAAHRDSIFRPLRKVNVGDVIELRTETGMVRYRVNTTEIVAPTDVGVLQSRGKDELTLITCFPFQYVGHAPNRFIVRASEIVPSKN
jgi:sortase A